VFEVGIGGTESLELDLGLCASGDVGGDLDVRASERLGRVGGEVGELLGVSVDELGEAGGRGVHLQAMEHLDALGIETVEALLGLELAGVGLEDAELLTVDVGVLCVKSSARRRKL
jgi:hypothetical protein